LIPLTIVKAINFAYIRSFEKNLPKFLDMVIENIKGGQTFLKALENASEVYKYPIGKEIKNAIAKFKLGLGFEESMNLAEKRLKIKQAKEFISIIKKAFFAGENAVNILKSASEYYWLLENYRATREAQLKIYIAVIVLSFIVFLFLSGITIAQLFKPLIQAQPSLEKAVTGQTALEVFLFKINLNAIISSLYWMGFFQALFSGLILSKIIYNCLGRGLIYSLSFLLLLILFYNTYPF
jgi:flagellar protein FlaJ